ncbi:MAG: nucleotidyltransferase domain-containing protein [Nitrosomonas sp.]|nr:nucleotidyltransferase domain-containing protein [Nitrosomonas sp.]
MTGEWPFGLSPVTLEKLNTVFAQHGAIDSVLIYGSRAKGNFRAGSDIDLTIKGDEIPFTEFMQIEDQIDDLMLPYTVDLSQYYHDLRIQELRVIFGAIPQLGCGI